MRFLLLVCAVTWHVTSSNVVTSANTMASTNAADGKSDNGLQSVTRSANTFAPNFFKTVAQSTQGNLICSPISASMVLSMAAYGARGNTAKQMRSVLALPENDALAKSGFQSFVDSFSKYKQVELRLANKIFIGENFKPKAEFQEMTKTGFRSEAQNLNFAKSVEASKTINDWCEAQTNHRIKDLIKPDNLDASTALVLVNAVYFKGNWSDKFDPANTKPRKFHVDGTTAKDVPTMYRSGSYSYGELPEVKAKFVELPYKSEGSSDRISMFIILPDEINGLAELEKNIEKVTMEKLLSGTKSEVKVYLPKFKIESEIPLNEPLAKMGLSEMFGSTADFTGIADAPPLKVSKVIQKAFIEVNEEGSEAAAATGLVMHNHMARPLPIEFNVNRPAHFIIATGPIQTGATFRNGVKLFSGSIHEPVFK